METAQRRPPIMAFDSQNQHPKKSEYITVVSVGSTSNQEPTLETLPSELDSVCAPGFVTVLKIGDALAEDPHKIEQVLVYRLPGERLGFGLKFEGGTKAAEFVKRLFIQSCAPDSPASRVRGSWGALVEGDEVLAIDSIPVNSMTRIDCVRCLKDSNVVIELMVKHTESKATEDLPLVIGAEKKRTPPPPPPVPPRKVPRRKEIRPLDNDCDNNPVPQSRHHQSTIPRPSRDRKVSDEDAPPDAEVYLDLFSHEHEPYCLSESDDTGSSISTVVDRFGSFPTTTTSSFAGSMPSTPTAVQKRIDLSQFITNPFDHDQERGSDQNENYLFDKLSLLQAKEQQHQDGMLQPPANFQDAPLSYADEDVRIVEANDPKPIRNKRRPPPPPPPRSKHTSTTSTIKERNNNDYNVQDENVVVACNNEKNLPRLVDFVPKSPKSEAFDSEVLKSFIEMEQKCHSDVTPACVQIAGEEDDDDDEEDGDFLEENNWNDGSAWYASNWSPTQLPTIGEADDEEERGHEQRKENEPIVINVERDKDQIISNEITVEESLLLDEVDGQIEESTPVPVPAPRTTLPLISQSIDVEAMETTPPPSINTRQPPDGHEFPDYQESHPTPIMPDPIRTRTSILLRKDQPKTSVKNMIAKFSTTSEDTTDGEALVDKKHVCKSATNINTMTTFDYIPPSCKDPGGAISKSPSPELTRLHTRSQSLVDISSSTNDRWAQILEQRRRGMSKLKGLIIPEHPDVQDASPIIDLPEIKSSTDLIPQVSQVSQILPSLDLKPHHTRNNSSPCLSSPIWNDSAMKYSPAFKRKTLQVCAPKTSRLPIDDPPKSLESITSPTRSDCSFEYASGGSSPESERLRQEVVKDDSDSDSALSSSQSSYVSRQSPPASPTRLHNCNQAETNRRLLKAQSVEAINRKNILASAKCRSGKDLNGSPQIQRKFEEENAATTLVKPVAAIQVDRISETLTLKSKSKEKKESITQTQKLNNVVASGSVTSSRSIISSKYISSRNSNSRTASVTDLRKNFEQAATITVSPAPAVAKTNSKINYVRHSSITSNGISTPSSKPTPSKRNSLPILTNTFKTTSVPSNAPAIITMTIKQWDESVNAADLRVITLRPDIPGCSIGITLAGGTDYETKDITIHKVRNGSVAHHDGRLHKGDRIFSINGKTMNGITHAQSIAILKEPVAEVVLVISPGKEPSSPMSPTSPTSTTPTLPLTNGTPSTMPTLVKQQDIVVKLFKDAAASSLGFSLEGGKESSQGDVPLTIKKLFTGGIAGKCGLLAVGDELLEIQGVDVSSMPRIDVWALMKKIPVGEVTLKLRR